ncbi:LOW QUALITY PROTEIN: kanadaptin [Sebastes umbrosus]|uniref:LOW QUALITY PROTEIN: kanadaptin n=1 Tax=Sebastes umbrosus TaxID=72105 RepID=UPI00189ED31F|nr:LOW QUALITY PROTEIN: kanadaptin [Sebastes umbrosus]
MAASPPPSDVCVKKNPNMSERMNSAMETDECSSTENGSEEEKKTEPPETEDTFKKPALFAAPSFSSRRSHAAAPSRPTAPTETKHVEESTEAVDSTSEDTSGVVHENKTTEKDQEEDEKDEAPVNTKPEAKARVLPAKGPPAAGKFPPIPYTEPLWGDLAPDVPYALEILKNGTIVDTVPLTEKSYFVVGRLPVCDVALEHPSISRYHAILQYRRQAGEGESVGEERGFYVHDLGSTHGTVVNKNKIPPKTYIRLRVGHVLKFGGSTRLFILQGPEFDEEEESELTVTELREKARKQKAELEKMMMGDGSDDDDDDEKEKKEEDGQGESNKGQSKASNNDSGCSWGMDDEVVPEEDENEENPFSTEFQEDQEAAYLKDPKKALQGFYDREGEELEFEYEDKSHGSWFCRIKLPVDDALGRQLVAEVTHTGKKKDTAIQCCLEACRMLEARGLLRQEAVSRKRKKKNWEDEDYYDSDDDTFLDRTGTVEKKRQERMKKAGKVDERPETYESLVAKLSEVEKELAETQKKLSGGRGDSSGSSTEDPLDAFMTSVRSEAAMDAVERRKLHVHSADLRKDAQRLRKLVELTRPAQMPSLLPSGSSEKPKKTLPLFGAMKGGSKYKLKTGTIGKLPPKRPNLPAQLFNMKELSPSGEVEEEDEEEQAKDENEDNDDDKESATITESNVDSDESGASTSQESTPSGRRTRQPARPRDTEEQSHKQRRGEESTESMEQDPQSSSNEAVAPSSPGGGDGEPAAEPSPRKNVKKKKAMGPSRPPRQLSGPYPEDDPDYCVWLPPTGQSGDGRTHLNDKYGY